MQTVDPPALGRKILDMLQIKEATAVKLAVLADGSVRISKSGEDGTTLTKSG